MKMLWACVLTAATALAQSQSDPKVAPPRTLAELGFSYSLSPDWILATTMMRRQAAAQGAASSGSVLIAAVYVPEKKKFSESSPFFSVIAFHDTHVDCKQFLDAMVLQLEKQDKTRIKNGPQQFSAGSNNFYRTDFEQNGVLRHRSLVCTTAKDYVLVWNAGARDDKGLEAVVSTLNSITPGVSGSGSAPPPAPTAPAKEGSQTAQTIRVASGVSSGLLVKKVSPVYPTEARAAYIQGTVILNADISKEGDIVNLEVLDGPIELVGSAVDAVRRWKYRPYILNGEPVAVRTEIQVNYQLMNR